MILFALMCRAASCWAGCPAVSDISDMVPDGGSALEPSTTRLKPRSYVLPLHADIKHQRSCSAMRNDVFPPFQLNCTCAPCPPRAKYNVFASSRTFCAWSVPFGVTLLSSPACCADPAAGCAVLADRATRPHGVLVACTHAQPVCLPHPSIPPPRAPPPWPVGVYLPEKLDMLAFLWDLFRGQWLLG